MRTIGGRKDKKRNKRTERKIQRLLIVVIFVFSMCRNMEIMLETKEAIETIGNSSFVQNNAWKSELCGKIENQWIKAKQAVLEREEINRQQELLKKPLSQVA